MSELRGLLLAVCVATLVAACASTPPTPSSSISPTQLSLPTTAPSVTPTLPASVPPSVPTPGAESSTGEFPATALGLPVLSVDEMAALSTSGKLNGRFVAVGGYWMALEELCPYTPHVALLTGYCISAGFADTPGAALNAARQGHSFAPIAGPEAMNGDLLWSAQAPDTPAALVLVVHASDSRVWQCAPDQRPGCRRRLVIDAVAWTNGEATQPAEGPGGTILSYQIDGTQLMDVDPRFAGVAQGLVRYVRVLAGAPDADATAAGVVTLVDDVTGLDLTSLPLAVDAGYSPGRLIVDAEGQTDQAYPHFTIGTAGSVVADFGSDSAPLVLDPGAGYTLHGFLVDAANNPIEQPKCDQPLTVDPNANLAYTATFTSAACSWAEAQPSP